MRPTKHDRTKSRPAEISVLVRKRRIERQVRGLLPKREDRAWLAGIIEGEGSVLWAKYGDYEWRAKISIYMNDGLVISHAAHLMGSTAFYDKRRKRWHTYAEGFRAIESARQTLPFMRGLKKILASKMVRVGHIVKGPYPPWRFRLAFDRELNSNIRALEFVAISKPENLTMPHKALREEK